MSIVKRLFYFISLLVAVLLTACSSNESINNEEPLPEGMGRIRITICTPETAEGATRAVNLVPWEDPDHNWEKLQTFRIERSEAEDWACAANQVNKYRLTYEQLKERL